MKNVTLLVLVIGFVLPFSVYAGPIIRSGETVSIDASQVLKGDFYGLGGLVTISGSAEDDAYIAGGTVTVNAPVAGDLTIAGGAVQVHGPVGDDLRVVGGDVTIADSVKGDIVVVGGHLALLSTATVGGDLIFVGGEASVEGTVTGGILGTADKVRINGAIGGDVSITAGTLVTLGDNADISGSVVYESRNDLVRAQDARIGGDVRKVESALEVEGSLLRTYALSIVVLVFAALAIFFIARARVVRLTEITSGSLGISGLIGLGIFLGVPFVGGLLVVSVIGTLLGVLLFVLYVLSILTALILSGTVLGYQLGKRFAKQSAVTLSTVALGTIALTLLALVPYVGGFVFFACLMVVLGGLGTSFYRAIRG